MQLTFERFLARLFRGDGQRWVLKGGYALELRLSGTVRATTPHHHRRSHADSKP